MWKNPRRVDLKTGRERNAGGASVIGWGPVTPWVLGLWNPCFGTLLIPCWWNPLGLPRGYCHQGTRVIGSMCFGTRLLRFPAPLVWLQSRQRIVTLSLVSVPPSA